MSKQNITITLKISELAYDIQSRTAFTSRSRKDGTNNAAAAHMQLSEEAENQMMRFIGDAWAVLRQMLCEWIDSDATSANNAQLDRKCNIKIALRMPSNYNNAAVESLTSVLHQYLVNMSVGYWFTATDKADAADYFAFATSNLDVAKEALSSRVRPTKY